MAENLPHHTPSTTPMQSVEWEGELPGRLRAAFPALTIQFKTYLGQNWIELPPADVPELLQHLRDEERFDMLVDLTAVDRPKDEPRFEIIYVLYSFSRNERVRVKTHAALDAEVPTAVNAFPGANWLEREVFDMFGVRFAGHPDLKRILLPEEWQGFPLRKEASITGMDNEWVKRNLEIESGQ
jgi:NADH-quinone oxidoreductase subunit C